MIVCWEKYSPFFKKSEFDCKETGENSMRPEFLNELHKLRLLYGKPMVVTSGYRSVNHSIEVAKGHSNGEHTKGMCADIRCNGAEAFDIMRLIFVHGLKINRIGVSQSPKGARFLHLGMGGDGLPTETIWSY